MDVSRLRELTHQEFQFLAVLLLRRNEGCPIKGIDTNKAVPCP